MSLKGRYKNDMSAVKDGVWHEFEKNTDGTVPRFKLARAATVNKEYQKQFRAALKKYNVESEDLGAVEDDVAEAMLLEVFANAVLVDWENFQPEDDGKNLKYSPKAVKEVIGSPEWSDFYAKLREDAAVATNYRIKNTKAEAKN